MMVLIPVYGQYMDLLVHYVMNYIQEIMERIPINKLVLDVLNEGCWDYDDYLDSDIEDFNEIIPETITDREDKIDFISNFLFKEIEVLDDIVNYRDLEKGYEERTLILKYKDTIFGLDYTYSVWTDWNEPKGYIDELPKYKEVQVTTYEQI